VAAASEGMPELIAAVLLIAPPLEAGAKADVEYEFDMRKSADRVNSDIFMVFDYYYYYCAKLCL
jgi:hypothetical protein